MLEALRISLIGRLRERPTPDDILRMVHHLQLDVSDQLMKQLSGARTFAEVLVVFGLAIYGGASAAGTFPDCVAVRDKFNNYDCSGVLISDKFALTTEHCQGVSAVFVGDATQNIGAGEVIPAKAIASDKTLDVMLIELDHAPALAPSATRGHVTAGCTFKVGRNLTAVGFGYDYVFGPSRGVKQWGEMPIKSVSNSDPCAGCVVESNGKASICFGDSGGPAYAADSNGNYLLVGLAQTVGGTAKCGADSVFTRIDSTFVTWVKNNCGVVLTVACPP